jgi:hypothetical protein
MIRVTRSGSTSSSSIQETPRDDHPGSSAANPSASRSRTQDRLPGAPGPRNEEQGATASSSTAMPPRRDNPFDGYTAARQPSTGEKAAYGAMGTVAAPLNAVRGAIVGAVQGMSRGGEIGNAQVPVVGALVGGLVGGAAVGLVKSMTDVKHGLEKTRRGMGRYGTVNDGFSIRTDSVATLQKALAEIPEDRVSHGDDGHVHVRVDVGDFPLLADVSIVENRAVATRMLNMLTGPDDLRGSRLIDVTALLATMDERGKGHRGKKVAVKARELNAPVTPHPQPQLCTSREKDNRTSIYIESNLTDPHRAALAGLQFFHVLDSEVNGD